jgi:4-pyridoxate dehydrogenase
MPDAKSYDYIIVGAGSAGCTLAGRLSEDRGLRVLLIEAGGWDRDPWIHIPLGWGKIVPNRLYDWMYSSEKEPQLNGREIECTRGKVIGGCSSINAMGYVRGHRADYDRWAASGLTGWSYAEVLPYFRRQESWEGGSSQFRGGDGPIGTQKSRFVDPIVQAYMEGGQRAGHPLTDDYNGAQQEGFGAFQATIHGGRRCSAAVAYLKPALQRDNLTVIVDALATRVLLDGHRAVGIEYLKGGSKVAVRADREVVLAGGVINSPQLLMLSGIGDPDELRAHDISSRVPLRGVGKNLQDHLWAGVEYRRKQPGTFYRQMRADRVAISVAQAYLFRTGFWTDIPSGWTAFLRTHEDQSVPDIQILFRALPTGAGPYLSPFKEPFRDGFACRALMLRPQSRGMLKLVSADPRVAPHIHFNFLAVQSDWQTLRAGIRLIRDLAKQAPIQQAIEAELLPGPVASSDEDLDAHIRASSATAHHPLGTCKMGLSTDGSAVVDPELRVHGVDSLRVVDASVMPDLVGGNIHAPVVMIAEKAADLMLGKPPLSPIVA